jgi:drug/metabolite transporter (DMT)-like permease
MRERQKAVILLGLTALLWSTGGLLIKWIEWHTMAIAGMRSAIAAVFLLVVLGRPRFTWSGGQIGGALAYAASVLCFVAATKLTTAANAILLVYTSPLYVALFSPWFLREKVSGLDWLTVLAVISGMGLFFLDQLTVDGWWGNICGIGSGMGAAWIVLCLRKQRHAAPLQTVLLGNILAAMVGVPFMFDTFPGASSWLALGLAGTVQIGLSSLLYIRAIQHLSAVDTTLVTIIEPLLNPLWVWLLLGERPGPWAVLGGAVVVLAVAARGVGGPSRATAASRSGEMCYNQPPKNQR